MQFFDPLRPRASNGLPKHLSYPAILPDLSFRAYESEAGVFWEIGCMVPSSRNAYRWAQIEMPKYEDVVILLQRYLEDPEEVLERVFGFVLNEAAETPQIEPAGTETLSLDDLGF